MPLEIERKFLVAPTPIEWPVPYADSNIVQVYLEPRDARVTSERVRMRIPFDGGETVYTHTKKVHIADGVHEETERTISKRSYGRFLARGFHPGRIICKRRRVFDWAGHTFELDTFYAPFHSLVILEVEFPSMDTAVVLPPFISIVREVTTERELTNAALASKGYWP